MHTVYDDLGYGAVIVARSHCESSPGSLDECRLSAGWLPTLRPSQTTWAVSPPVGCTIQLNSAQRASIRTQV